MVQWLARYKPRQLAKSGAVKAVMQVLCQLCAEPDLPGHDDADQLPAAKFAAQVTHLSHVILPNSGNRVAADGQAPMLGFFSLGRLFVIATALHITLCT